MEIRIEDIRTPPVPRVADDGQLSEASAPGPVDWKFLCERERVRAEDAEARADAAEARCEELRWREVRARQRASSLDAVGKSNRAKLKAAREEVREVRRTAKRAVALEREAARLALDRLAERDRQIEQRNQQLAEQEQQLAGLREENTLLRDEIRELKKLPKRPRMKPSGMASSKDEDTDNSASGRSGEAGKGRRKGRGPRRRLPDRHRRDVKVCLDDVPEGAVHKGYVDHTVREIVFHAEEVTYRCEVWRFPDGSRHTAPLPPGVATGREQYGPGVKALVIMLYYQCQSTIRRIVSILNDMGLDISARQVGRFLTADAGGIVAEQQEVLRAGMETASWINVDDTGARHKAENGYCTAIGNDLFAHFRSSGSKSRLDFLEHLCAGEETCTVNEAALDYMRKRKLPRKVIERLASHGQRRFGSGDEWRAHLEALGIAGKKNQVKVATEGALWGTISDGGRIAGTVILSDDAGQFNVGDLQALCWIHAERNVSKLDGNTPYQHERVAPALDRMWKLYRSLARYRKRPTPLRKQVMETRFDRIFGMRTGYASLDRMLERLKANKDQLLRVLDHPETPLHTNKVENDIRDNVIRRKISFGTRSEAGRAARDAYTGGKKTCQKLGLPFWDYLRNRLGVAGAPDVPRLADLIRQRAATQQPDI